VQFVAVKGLDFPDDIGQLSDESVPLVAGKNIKTIKIQIQLN